jgi:glyoxylase-like metal-dependent hydrolase (beta-lactamase superfamily II)
MTGSVGKMSRSNVEASIRTVQIGSSRVSYVPDGVVKMVPQFLFPDTTDDDWVSNGGHLDDSGWLTVSSGGLLVERDDRAILLDSGFGPYPTPTSNLEYGMAYMRGGAFLDNLRTLGREPRDIEAIAISHLHVEHVGWAAEPEFAHTAVLLSAIEWGGRKAEHGVTEEVLTALTPRIQTIRDGEEIFPGVRALALPGHTPGQTGFEVDGGDMRLLVFADALHSALQVTHPQWALMGDLNPERSAQTRQDVLGRLTDTGTIGFGIHFADVQFGRPRKSDGGLEWEPLD